MPSILGISFSTWSLGLAILSYGDLTKWQRHRFEGTWSPKKCSLILHKIQQYIDRNNVEIVAVKIPDELIHLTNGIQKIIGALNVLIEKRGIKVHYYTLDDLKRFHSPEVCINKKVLIDCILRKYPDLYDIYRKEKEDKRTYYIKTFEAVACAHVCYKEQIDH